MREMPPGRQPIATTARPESRRDEVYAFVRREIAPGRQAYVIYPLVEESAKVELKAATEMADHLVAGRLSGAARRASARPAEADAKDRVMGAFVRGEFDILVVDDGDGSRAWMWRTRRSWSIEHAERFGLSQLHQLRGRVGRGAHKSYCVMLYQYPMTDQGRERLKALTDTTDGFEIAERDLQLRGPGDFFGTRQSGMPTLRVGDLLRDHALDGGGAARSRGRRWTTRRWRRR